jgi:hypothetical protein
MAFASAAPLGMALLGLLLGMRHATDPDHVVAVTTILTCARGLRAAAPVGAVWGCGHTLTVLLVGSAIIVLKIAIPVRLGLATEFSVAVVLIVLGGGALGGRLLRFAITPPDALPTVHTHVDHHDGITHRHVHAHFPLNPHDNLRDRNPSIAAAQSLPRMHAGLVTSSAALSLGFGLFLGYQISFVDHLFGTTPLWLPHWQLAGT